MFRRLDDFTKAWTEEAKHTLALLETIPDASLDIAIADGHRDLRRLAWHLVESLIEMPARMGLAMPGAHLVKGGFIGSPPDRMADVDGHLRGQQRGAAQGYGDLVRRGPGAGGRHVRRDLETRPQPVVLLVHQAHHRGQMTVLMRQARLPVPPIYGPVKEGWSAYGVEPPKV